MQSDSLTLASDDGETFFEDEGEVYHFRHDEFDDPTPTEPVLAVVVTKDWTATDEALEEETTKVMSVVLLG